MPWCHLRIDSPGPSGFLRTYWFESVPAIGLISTDLVAPVTTVSAHPLNRRMGTPPISAGDSQVETTEAEARGAASCKQVLGMNRVFVHGSLPATSKKPWSKL